MAMKKGDRGEGVRALQEKLNSWISGCHDNGQETDIREIVTDGAYGDNTRFVVARYQQFIGCSPSGVADETTLSSLELCGDPGPDGISVIDSTGGGV